MNITASDSRPLLVAPRPVRISSGHFARAHPVTFVSSSPDQLGRVKVASDGNGHEEVKVGVYTASSPVSDKDMASPRTSSRSSLPSEALEEFLSILRPTIFAPTSPILRARIHSGTISLPNMQCDRQHPFNNQRGRLEVAQHRKKSSGLPPGPEDNTTDRTQMMTPTSSGTPESVNDNNSDEGGTSSEFDVDLLITRWHTAQSHASPVSRMHTRNPFQRHPSYEMPRSPTPPLSPMVDPQPLSPLAEASEASEGS